MIVKDIKVYDGPLIHKRFAYDYFRNKTLPIGNIIAFRCPMDVSISGMIDQEDVLQGDYIYSDDYIPLYLLILYNKFQITKKKVFV